MRKILFLSLALFATLASGAYGQQVAGTDPERNVSSGAILSVSGYSNPVFISSGTNGTTPYFIAVTGGGGVTLTNNSGGGQGVVSAFYGGKINLGNGTVIYTSAVNTSTGIVGATGILARYSSNGVNPLVIAANVTVNASGDRPYGIYAVTNGIINLTGLTSVNINLTADHADGDSGSGIVANENGAVTAENVKVSAAGSSGYYAPYEYVYGMSALNGGKVSVSGSASISVNASNGYGARAEGANASLQLNTVAENVTGTAAYGIYGASGGTVSVSGASGTSDITVSATDSACGIGLKNSATVNVNNADINVSGAASAAAIKVENSPAASTVNVSNSSLKSNKDGITASGGSANITFQNTSLEAAANIFNISNNSVINFTGDAMTLNGSAAADVTSTLNVTLKKGSLWNLSGQSNISKLTLDNSRANVGAGSALKNVNFLSGSQVYYADGAVGNRSSVFTQSGSTPATIGMQFNSNTSYDRLTLGAASSGSYNVDLVDINPSGKNPKQFKVPDMVATSGSPVTFHLLKPTYILGIYRYDFTELWDPVLNYFGFEAVCKGIDPVVGNEISASLMGSMAGGSKLIETASNNLMKRLGDLRLSKDAGSPLDSLWVRGYGKQYKMKYDMDGSVYGFEAGYDRAVDEDYKYHIGVMGGYGSESMNFTADSSGNLTAPSAGIYGTWLAGNGVYADVTGRYFWLTYEDNINPQPIIKPFKIEESAGGYAFSFELGKRFQTGARSRLFIEPRAQYNYGKTGGYTAEKNGIEMRAGDYVSSLGTLGVNAGVQIPGRGDKNTYEPYARLALKYEFDGKASAWIDDEKYSRDYGGARVEGALGFNAQIGAKLAVYAELSYENGSAVSGFGENIGIRFAFGEPRDKNAAIKRKEALAAVLEAEREKQRRLAEELARREAEETARKEKEARQAAINTASDDVLEKEKAAAQERRLKPVLKSFSLGTANFAVGKSDLTPKAQADIKKMAEEINNLSYRQITIEGHTDNTGSDELNKSLSLARAKSVFAELAKNGVPEDKMTYIGFASRMPVADNKTAEGRAKNRRVEIFVE